VNPDPSASGNFLPASQVRPPRIAPGIAQEAVINGVRVNINQFAPQDFDQRFDIGVVMGAAPDISKSTTVFFGPKARQRIVATTLESTPPEPAAKTFRQSPANSLARRSRTLTISFTGFLNIKICEAHAWITNNEF